LDLSPSVKGDDFLETGSRQVSGMRSV